VLPVVVIDDNPDDVFLITRLLTKTALRNPRLEFTNPDEAVRYFLGMEEKHQTPAALVFCDIKMPVTDGFDVLAQLRELKTCLSLPIYMLSGSALEADKIKAADLGANGYLVKFPELDVLNNIVSSVRASSGENGTKDELKSAIAGYETLIAKYTLAREQILARRSGAADHVMVELDQRLEVNARTLEALGRAVRMTQQHLGAIEWESSRRDPSVRS
jgi:CheY-like chemotaxis protein